MKPLVSICIPTFNRSECLQQTLESIITQMEFVDGRVEIVISDNASTDDTKTICDRYSKKYRGIHYYCNSQNIRDKNFPKVLSRATGKLRKLNNDTAVMRPGSLSYLCDMEQKYEHGKPLMFFSNGNNISKTGDKDSIFLFDDFVNRVSYWTTWIASFSLWEDDCINIDTDTDGCELLLWQVKKIYEIGSKKNSVAICPQKLIDTISPPKKDISYGLYKVFYENYFKIIDPFVEKGYVSKKVRDELEKDLFVKFFPGWIVQWEINNSKLQYSNDEDLKKIVFDHCKTKSYWYEFLLAYWINKTKDRIRRLSKILR